MDKFTARGIQPIFFGSQDCEQECYRLHKLLEEAFVLLSGIQQPPACTEEPCPEEDLRRSRDEDRVRLIAAEIAGKLGHELAEPTETVVLDIP